MSHNWNSRLFTSKIHSNFQTFNSLPSIHTLTPFCSFKNSYTHSLSKFQYMSCYTTTINHIHRYIQINSLQPFNLNPKQLHGIQSFDTIQMPMMHSKQAMSNAFPNHPKPSEIEATRKLFNSWVSLVITIQIAINLTFTNFVTHQPNCFLTT